MKYLLLICVAEGTRVSPEEANPDRWVAEMTERRVRLLGSEVGRARDTTTVRVRNGELLLTDGPFDQPARAVAAPGAA